MDEREFQHFKIEVIDRLTRIETRLEQLNGKSKWETALIEVVRVLVSALVALAGVKAMGGI